MPDDRARRLFAKTTYFGSAPVHIDDYIQSIKLQSIEKQNPTRDELRAAFSDLLIPPQLLARLGPARETAAEGCSCMDIPRKWKDQHRRNGLPKPLESSSGSREHS